MFHVLQLNYSGMLFIGFLVDCIIVTVALLIFLYLCSVIIWNFLYGFAGNVFVSQVCVSYSSPLSISVFGEATCVIYASIQFVMSRARLIDSCHIVSDGVKNCNNC